MARKKKQQFENPQDSGQNQPARAVGKTLEVPVVEEPTESVRHFFRPADWLSALAATLFSGLVFYYYMAPEVTLQDSGELVTGAFTLGVPHPPGYPLWACLGFIWSHFILPFGNPAWRIGMMSVVTGALVVGAMTVMMTRGIRLFLHSMPWAAKMDEKLLQWIAVTIGISSALLFGFNRGVWLWACVSEMRVLNVFLFVLLACIFFAWIIQPRRRGFLYASLLILGLSLANHQTVGVMVLPLGMGALAVGLEEFVQARRRAREGTGTFGLLMTSLSSCWELAASGLICGMIGLIVLAWLKGGDGMVHQGEFSKAFVAGVGAIALLVVGKFSGWWKVRRALACAGAFLVGVSFYIYMPISAKTNPPMNWGYAGTREGFLHAVTRGQYEKMQTAHVFSSEFLLKIKVFTLALIHQYSLPLTLLGLVTIVVMLVWWMKIKPHGRAWMVFVWAAFLATSLGLLTIINPKLDKQEQEITIKFFAPAHGFYAMLIGFGIAALLGLLACRGKFPGSGFVVRMLCVAALAMPLVTYHKNLNLCNLRGHDFGYLFGYLMFEPGGGYPSMDRDAVLYGGTDPGRFVPTYMIFCESRVKPKDRFRNKDFDRSDVYIITQNALADNTYMSYIRDHYDYSRPTNNNAFQRLLHRDHTYPKEPIYIPSPNDNNQAFRQYFDDVQSGRINAGADVKTVNGRMEVQGVGGVMAINGILAQWIFDKNKDKHSFYVEESYVIPWMYPYMRPAGVIMKIEKDKIPSPQERPDIWQEIVKKDRDYWDKLTADFLARDEFKRSNDARKSFSKLRSALSGLYSYRGMMSEAEYALKQSLQLCPDSPEANFRLADLYMQLKRYPEAKKLIEDYQALDIYNTNVKSYLENIKNVEQLDLRRIEIEKKMSENRNSVDLNQAVELAAMYQRLNMEPQFRGLAASMLAGTNLPPNAYVAIAQISSGGRCWDISAQAWHRYLEVTPGDARGWIDLAAADLAMGRQDESVASLRRAVGIGGDGVRETIRSDNRFGALQSRGDFRSIVVPAQPMGSRSLPFGSRLDDSM